LDYGSSAAGKVSQHVWLCIGGEADPLSEHHQNRTMQWYGALHKGPPAPATESKEGMLESLEESLAAGCYSVRIVGLGAWQLGNEVAILRERSCDNMIQSWLISSKFGS
jgi:hypothetical protein